MSDTHIMDEMKNFSIHRHEFNQLPKSFQKLALEYEELPYVNLETVGDRTVKVKKLVREYAKAIKDNKGKETNLECMILSVIFYMLNHMTAAEIRKLKLEKLLNK